MVINMVSHGQPWLAMWLTIINHGDYGQLWLTVMFHRNVFPMVGVTLAHFSNHKYKETLGETFPHVPFWVKLWEMFPECEECISPKGECLGAPLNFFFLSTL